MESQGNNQVMIEVDGLTKLYGRVPAIQDLAFHADKGEIVGFLGPNGAGKTTTMRILTGYLPPTSGTARIAGFDVLEESLQARRRIGYLPETVPLYPELTVVEYLEYMGRLRAVESLHDRIELVVEQVRLLDRADQFIGGLSKGLRQRVGLAQALLHEPEVLILDEPTIGLDPAQIREVRELIRQVGQERTVLLSTHILSEAQQVCHRVLIINKGQIVAEDTPDNLQAQLRGGDRIRLRAAGADVGSVLQKIDSVERVEPGDRDQEWLVFTQPGVDLRPIIARRLVEAGAELFELSGEGLSLEDVFLKLTEEAEGEAMP